MSPAVSYASSLSASAAGINISQTGSITLTEDTSISANYIDGAVFRLYKAATLNDDLTFGYTTAFSSAGASSVSGISTLDSVSGMSNAQLESTAEKLIGLVNANGITASDTQTMTYASETSPTAICTFDNLSTGLYLIQGETKSVRSGDTVKTNVYQPQLIIIPWRISTADQWEYAVTTVPKYTQSVETQKQTEKTTEKQTEKATEKPTEKTTEKTTEAPPEKTTETSSEKTTEVTTGKTTETTSETTSEKTSETATEKNTEKPTESISETSSETDSEKNDTTETTSETTETSSETTSEESETSEKITETETPVSTESEQTDVKTGDDSRTEYYVMLALAAAGAAVICIKLLMKGRNRA